ncbi:biopolymer transporter ExbD [Glaciecola sp. XM2]|jgi:biopolymer transport protein ExbD|uniref:ExbD/TolR family protein n=1 Tax=Glaciecola sp. XM2 TaxID=1914931 RepID=UPI001BDEDA68|nr:biopolymer transporter ExbD [Glaciecola sp. XM2]MBT1451539.1 biopolymer transporter ExbD [Glaciecola sp. XM2]
MKQSAHAKRMARNHKRHANKAKLSLVSLMDIFTILVFFLMLNASDVQVLQSSDDVVLPNSTADTPAKETLLLMVTKRQILLQGKPLADTQSIIDNDAQALDSLEAELDYHTSRKPNLSDEEKLAQSITIMGDSATPYVVLKQVMQAAAAKGYTNIALAVENTEDSGTALSSGGSR